MEVIIKIRRDHPGVCRPYIWEDFATTEEVDTDYSPWRFLSPKNIKRWIPNPPQVLKFRGVTVWNSSFLFQLASGFMSPWNGRSVFFCPAMCVPSFAFHGSKDSKDEEIENWRSGRLSLIYALISSKCSIKFQKLPKNRCCLKCHLESKKCGMVKAAFELDMELWSEAGLEATWKAANWRIVIAPLGCPN